MRTLCESSDCSSNDPNCDATTKLCKNGYQTCCDQWCHSVHDPCPYSNDTMVNYTYDPHLRRCNLYKCNLTDPNCDVIGRRCKDGYRMCCDGLCHDKQESCDNIRESVQHHFDFLQHMNETQYKKHISKIKQIIKQYISMNPCWPPQNCLNRTTCKPEYLHCDTGQCVRLLSNCPMWWEKNDFLNPSNKTCYPNELCFRNQCRAP